MEGSEGKIVFRGKRYDEIVFQPVDPHKNAFELKDVTIGVNFHWERKEDQRFLGGLKFIVENDAVTAINIVALEDYLTSVISSEMSATVQKQLLKAHAVISHIVGCWLKPTKNKSIANDYRTEYRTSTELIRWYDREDHLHFDVCADDHCQRYQGTKESTALVKTVIEARRNARV